MSTQSAKLVSRYTKLSDIMNTCVTLAQSTGPTVRRVMASGSLGTFQKGQSKMDVCTEADLKI